MRFLAAFTVAAVRAAAAASAAAEDHSPAAASVPGAAAAAANLELGFLGLRPVEESPNAVFSPLSILSVLALAAEGASGECRLALDALLGDTSSGSSSSKRMREALLVGGDHLVADKAWLSTLESRGEENGSPFPVLEVVARLYVDLDVGTRPAFQRFKEALQRAQLPSSVVHATDFAQAGDAAAEMNGVVAAATRGRINSLISASTVQASRLVLLNAVYFNSQWLSPFHAQETVLETFRAAGEGGLLHAKEVPFMQQRFPPGTAAFARASGVEVVGLPYSYPGAWLFLYKPEDPSAFAQQTVSSPASLAKLVESAREAHRQQRFMLNLSLPKFHLVAANNKFDAVELLQRMGLAACMRPCAASEQQQHQGNSSSSRECVGAFDRLGGERSGLYVSAFDHQADIRVSEEGTEAAAATASAVMDSGFFRTAVETVSFDSPFFFELRLQTVASAAASAAAAKAAAAASAAAPVLLHLQLPLVFLVSAPVLN
ncbi:hypothetical protein Esti_002447 [Eimeria stiedai]